MKIKFDGNEDYAEIVVDDTVVATVTRDDDPASAAMNPAEVEE